MRRSISLHVLTSGSKGNTSVVVNERTGQSILVDCGCRKMDLAGFYDEMGYDPALIAGVLITHDHNDHVKSLAMLMRYFKKAGAQPFVHTLEPLIAPCREKTQTPKGNLAEFEALRFEETVQIAGLNITPLQTSHDATASCGFFFEAPKAKAATPPFAGDTSENSETRNQETATKLQLADSLAFVTDTGILPHESARTFTQARVLALECNHDAKMLKYGPYPRFLKERIASEVGHLSNDQAADLVREYTGSSLEALVAMHLSQDNNLASVVRQTIQPVLDELGNGTELHISRQFGRISIY